MRRASSRRDRVQASRSRQHEFVIDERVPPVDRTPPLVVAAFLVLADRVLAVSGLIELIESAGDPGVGKGQERQDRDREQQARGHSTKAARHRRKSRGWAPDGASCTVLRGPPRRTAAFVTPAWSLACLAFMSATTSQYDQPVMQRDDPWDLLIGEERSGRDPQGYSLQEVSP